MSQARIHSTLPELCSCMPNVCEASHDAHHNARDRAAVSRPNLRFNVARADEHLGGCG